MRPCDQNRPRSGKHINPRFRVSANADTLDMLSRAAIAGGYLSLSAWALRVLVIAAAYEMRLDVDECLKAAELHPIHPPLGVK